MKRMSFGERIRITKRGFGILRKYCPGLSEQKALYEFIHSLQPFITIWFSARIVDELTNHCRKDYIASYVICVITINFICIVFQNVLLHICNEKESQMWIWFEKVFSDKQMSLDYDDLEDVSIQKQRQEVEENLFMFGNGLAQLVWGTSVMVKVFVNIFVALLMSGTLFISKTGEKIVDHPIWIVAILGCITLCGFSNYKATRKENSLFMKWCDNSLWFNRTFMFFGHELYTNLERAKDVRIYRQDTLAIKKIEELEAWGKAEKKNSFHMAFFPSVAGFIVGLGNCACYLFVAIKAFLGAYGVGSVVQYVSVLTRLGDGIRDLMFMVSDNELYCAHLKKMYDYLDIPNHMYQGSLTVEKREDNEYYIEFRNVSFKYPRTENYVLRNVNLKFKIGEKLAVVGMNGSGKTTFIKLLCRLYDPTEGEILLNNVDIRKYDYKEYMSIFSVVFQDFKLFSFGLGQNVSASFHYNEELAKKCLEKAGFYGRLQSMKKGLETSIYKDLDEEGVEISGGEAQKIALARALYKNAPFIILDEPTAALDPIAEYEVYSKFNEIVQDKTAIYISHRLSSCRFCDVIAVFDGGQIVQRGVHDRLLQDTHGKYYELWNAQAQYYT
ncbi:ABC transporter ATP-binding protein [Agathobacter sp.]|uniref:ABC transporter ATP-binding protein n=1 Tax=Agathobacter sp. TaxID=2021311 RepID=UPI002A91DE0E|nr:ABC transporter ATP-binding protein [Agathobacter sp.]MDY5862025.1 ABC transporter ATP-binding protein [Agathobacter sp.]